MKRDETITLRDHYAAHAPLEPQWSFPVRGYINRPKPEFSLGNWCVNEAELRAFDNGKAKAARQQWPFVWADAMLSERGL